MASREEFRVEGLPEPISHYTDAVRVDGLLFISGCGPFSATGELMGADDVAVQTRQTLENIGKILAAAGASFADVASVTVYLTDINDRPKINPVRQEFFGSSRPASTLVEVSALASPEMKVEIQAVAAIPRRQQ
jgi:reactive intermediate/imine deaminase